MNADKTLDRCHCGEPLYEKVGAGGGTYVACHHCDRPCLKPPGTCPLCSQSGAWKPDYEEGAET